METLQSKFNTDLKVGNSYEKWFIELNQQYNKIEYKLNITDNYMKLKGWDVEINGDKYEIKSDITNYQTGNDAIEFMCNGKQSGIMTTISKYWVIIHPITNEVIKFETKKLKELILECMKGSEYKDYFRCKGGDNDLAKMICFKMNDLIKYGNGKLFKTEIPWLYDITDEFIYKMNKKGYYKLVEYLENKR